jgi:hypothetical protein
MEHNRQAAYRTLLAHGLLHIKWDLACYPLNGRPSLWKWSRIGRAVRHAAHRVIAFHNLAIFSTNDFEQFDEDRFWSGLSQFHEQFPGAKRANYRDVFETALSGERVPIFRTGN